MSRFAYLRNPVSGQRCLIDTLRLRYWKMRQRVSGWVQVAEEARDGRFVMYTLTYKRLEDWAPGHISDFMMHLRKRMGKNLYGYAWVMELQKRGVPHYHVVVWVAVGYHCPWADDYWVYGITNTIADFRGLRYISKYMVKTSQEQDRKRQLPHGARLYAISMYRHAPLTNWAQFELWLTGKPVYLRDTLRAYYVRMGTEEIYCRKVRYGWVYGCGDLDECYVPSRPWEYQGSFHEPEFVTSEYPTGDEVPIRFVF